MGRWILGDLYAILNLPKLYPMEKLYIYSYKHRLQSVHFNGTRWTIYFLYILIKTDVNKHILISNKNLFFFSSLSYGLCYSSELKRKKNCFKFSQKPKYASPCYAFYFFDYKMKMCVFFIPFSSYTLIGVWWYWDEMR